MSESGESRDQICNLSIIYRINSKKWPLLYFESGLLGSMVPCVLYGSNVERLESAPGTFAHHCFTYSGLYLVGNTLFGWNCLAPWFSHRNRVAVRRKFNLEASKSHPSIFLQLCLFLFMLVISISGCILKHNVWLHWLFLVSLVLFGGDEVHCYIVSSFHAHCCCRVRDLVSWSHWLHFYAWNQNNDMNWTRI